MPNRAPVFFSVQILDPAVETPVDSPVDTPASAPQSVQSFVPKPSKRTSGDVLTTDPTPPGLPNSELPDPPSSDASTHVSALGKSRIGHYGLNNNGADHSPRDSLAVDSSPVDSSSDDPPLEREELRKCAEEWFVHCQYEQFSPRTLEVRRMFLTNLLWFLEKRGYFHCGKRELQQFFHYLRTGHEEAGGRWGKPHLTKALRPISVKDYFDGIKCFFTWMVNEEIIPVNPMQNMPRVRVREEVKQPLTPQQIEQLLRAAKVSRCPLRDEAILLMLFDSGIRASELIGLKVKDVDTKTGTFQVRGKGDKIRSCYLGKASTKALMVYLRRSKLAPDAPLFPAASGMKSGEPLTRSGLLTLIKRLASLSGFPITTHQLRRTFATTILQNGSDLVSVRDMLGHSSIHMSLKYLSVAKSHIEAQHRQFSPGDNLKPK